MTYTGWAIQPNWDTEVKIKYKFLTRVYSSYTYREQRLPVVEIPKLEMSFSIMEHSYNISHIKVTDTFVFPIFANPIEGTKTGASKINSATTLSFKENTVYLIDENGYYAEISSIVGQDINLSTAWGGVTSGTYYFGFAGVISQISKQFLWRDMVKLDLTCEEL